MSDAVDKVITELENNWGAKPKPGNVSPKAKAKKAGSAFVATGPPIGMAYTATPLKVDPGLKNLFDDDDADVALMDPNDPALATAIEEMNAALPSKENEMAPTLSKVPTLSKPVNMKIPKGCFDTSKMLTAPTVTMLKAMKLYQPVRGTSSGSRYFMIAIGPALRVSCRWKKGMATEGLALRVEGSGLSNPDTVKLLVQIGLDLKSPTHMSAHLTVANTVEARKAIGALLMAINEPWSTPMPDPEIVCV